MDNLYQQQILDHYKDPQNFGELNKECRCAEHNNPSCGDAIEMSICVKDEKIADIKFKGQGCAISMASTSMLTEKIKGMSVSEFKKMDYADIETMLGIPLSSARKRCAYLGFEVAKQILADYS